ncbi:hypothetical protein [Spiroplasma sp. AdecLV25b]|uniref:hypothetical protein n=1 Tax=Spiroplasma sp. AdecLV25b TaxID=3027162 RepID=UPI0027DFF5A9|nr:hypothetical protein [Spiroplasma sp. AdecLV25b]
MSEEYINEKLSELIFLEDNYKKIAKYFVSEKWKNVNLFSEVVIDRKSSTASSQFYLDLYESLIEFYKTGSTNDINKVFLKHQELIQLKNEKNYYIYKKKNKFGLSF